MTPSDPDPSSADHTTDPPVADIRTGGPASGLLRYSHLWWLTLASLLVAIALVWLSLPARGPRITIRFPEGHGLKVGDTMRHRGIETGEVTAIGLSDDLAAIDVQVTLAPAAAALAREGSRFWIVRPRLSLQGISGLETAVGAKYIGVSPGDPQAARRVVFDGLAAPPPDDLQHDGLEIVLRSDSRHGLLAGAPVTWRGVDVGQVLSVGLSPDARHVDVHVRIEAAYRKLVKTHSRFWVTSGLGVDFRLTGVKLTAESLATIARGGVSLITPRSESPPRPVVDGRVFPLHTELNPDWMEEAVPIALVDVSLPSTVTISGVREGSLLGIPRDRAFRNSGIIVRVDGELKLYSTADSFATADDGTLRQLGISQPGAEIEAELAGLRGDRLAIAESGAAVLTLPDGAVPDVLAAHTTPRVPAVPEECVVARSVASDEGPSSVMYAIGAERFLEKGALWTFTDDETDLTDWQGAPVIAVSDGRLIGLLQVTAGEPAVAPLSDAPASE